MSIAGLSVCSKAQLPSTVALWLNGSVAVNHAMTRGSNPSLYYIFGLFFIVFTWLGIRLGLRVRVSKFLGLGIVLVYLAYDAIVLPAGDI